MPEGLASVTIMITLIASGLKVPASPSIAICIPTSVGSGSASPFPIVTACNAALNDVMLFKDIVCLTTLSTMFDWSTVIKPNL